MIGTMIVPNNEPAITVSKMAATQLPEYSRPSGPNSTVRIKQVVFDFLCRAMYVAFGSVVMVQSL